MSSPARAVRAFAGPPVLTVLASTSYGTFAEVRERKGLAAWGALGEALLPAGLAARTRASDRLLTNDELWMVYRRCPEIRAAIDEIVRVTSTWDWCVEPVLDPADPGYEDAMDIARQAETFLSSPNTDGETWQTVLSKSIRDLMIYDAMAWEQVLGDTGLEEIVLLRGGDIQPVIDQRQHVMGYRQVTAGLRDTVEFTTEEISYLNLFPNTVRPGGTPIIETLIDEVLTLLRGARSTMLAFDSDEIPPGILLLAGIAGKAADRMVASLKNMAGNDQKLRVMTSDNPDGLKGEWLELRRTPKDLQYKEIIKEIKRTVWRLFGVKPVAMGDTEATPRATAEVQVDAQDSGLIQPILELIQGQINIRTLPLIVGNPEDAALVVFNFKNKAGRSAADEKALSDAFAVQFDRGVISPNEWRKELGRAPYDASGDVALLAVAGGFERLDSVVGLLDDNQPADDPAEEGADDATPSANPGSANPEGDEAAPGEAAGRPTPPARGVRSLPGRAGVASRRATTAALALAVRQGRARVATRRKALARAGWGVVDAHASCGHHACEPREVRDTGADEAGDVPQHWQAEGKFAGMRTLDLPKLARQVASYRRAVSPLWNRCRINITAAFQTALRDGRISGEEATALASTVQREIDILAVKWSARTDPHYRTAAKFGRDAATHHAKQPVVGDWRARGEKYHDRAMGYLTESGGLLSDVRAQLVLLAAASSRTPPAMLDTRATVADEDIASRILAAVTTTFSRNVARIANWGGRLIELSSDVMVDGMLEAEQNPVVEPDVEPAADGGTVGTGTADGGGAVEWMVEWVAIDDDKTCATCERESANGFQPLSGLVRRPGGDTECRGHCRCVLCFWTRAEVDNGTAKSFRSIRFPGRARARLTSAPNA